MGIILKQYKLPNGSANFPALFYVPTSERLPAMAKRDFDSTLKLIIGAVAMALKSMGIKRSLNEFQILTLAEEIIDTSDEDNLSLEDLVLFLQYLSRGKYGNIDDLSIPRFFNLFEIYRQERHSTRLNMLENEHLQYKGMGDTNRMTNSDPLAEHFNKLGSSLHELRMSLNQQKKESNTIKQAKDFYGE